MNAKLASPLFPIIAAALFTTGLSVGAAASLTNNPIADTFVATGPTGNLAGNDFGGGGALAVSAANLPGGEFQTLLKFDLSGVRSSLDAQFGAGLWTVQSVTLQLSSSPHNNAIFNNVAAGQFSVSLLQNNTWIEGSGTAGAPTTDGVSFTGLQGIINNSADQALGVFSFGGGTSGANDYSLSLTPGIIADLAGGSDLSLRLFAADSSVSYLFSSRTGSPAAVEPELIINAIPEPSAAVLSLLGLTAFLLSRVAKKLQNATGSRD